MSLMLDARYPDYPFTLAAAVAVREALILLSGIVTQIKWVNDLFFEQKKVCGILTETKIGEDNIRACHIGISIIPRPNTPVWRSLI